MSGYLALKRATFILPLIIVRFCICRGSLCSPDQQRISSRVGLHPLFVAAGACLSRPSGGSWFPIPWLSCCGQLSASLSSSSDCQLGLSGPACVHRMSDNCCLTSVISDLISSIPCAMLVMALSKASMADQVGGISPAGDLVASCGAGVGGSMVPDSCCAKGLVVLDFG